MSGKGVKAVAANSFMVEEFLARLHGQGELHTTVQETRRKLLLHGHCHQKALIGTGPSLGVLQAAARLRGRRGRFRLLRHGRFVRLRA